LVGTPNDTRAHRRPAAIGRGRRDDPRHVLARGPAVRALLQEADLATIHRVRMDLDDDF
jgi:hypothetical protein